MAATTTKPLMLKDFLALDDSNSDSSSNSFQCIPRRRGASALARISAAAINAVKSGPMSSPNRSFLPRSLSRRLLGRGFWWRVEKVEVEASAVRVKDIVRLNSFEMYSQRSSLYFPSPVPSSRSSSMASDDVPLGSEEFLMDSDANAEFTCNHQKPKEEPTNEEESECRDCQTEEEKEQLSPVSVMNFPFQGDEGDCNDNDEATSPCFEQSLANIERAKHQLLQKIRRFENLIELDPVDLIESFTDSKDCMSSDDYEEEEDVTGSSLIRRLRSVGPHKDLLVDFFDEGLIWTDDVEELLISAKKWIEGEDILIPGDLRKDQIKDMERNGRWRYFEDDKEDLVADMEIRMLGSLIEELVLDVVS